MVPMLPNILPVGYGLMNFTWRPSQKVTQEQFNDVMIAVVDGIRASPTRPLFLNGGEFYGVPDRHEGLKLLAGFFSSHPDYADKVYVSVKGGVDDHWLPKTDKEHIKKTLDSIDEILQPLYTARQILPKRLDMFTLARVGTEPIENTMELLTTQKNNGRFDAICFSEIGANTLERALKVGTVDAVEIEFSLFHREAAQNGVFQVCVRNKIPVICYSPLGKGLLAGLKNSDLAKDDFRNRFDKFSDPEAIRHNQSLVDKINEVGKAAKLTNAQVAISWIATLSSKSRDIEYPRLIPIPGSTSAKRQLENLSIKELDTETMNDIQSFLSTFSTAGHRYNKDMDQETYQ